MCYYCTKKTSSDVDIINHLTENHQDNEFCFWQSFLNENTGLLCYQAKHFQMKCSDLKGKKISLDPCVPTLRVKREANITIITEMNEQDEEKTGGNDFDDEGTKTEDDASMENMYPDGNNDDLQELTEMLPEVIDVLKGMGRTEDFVSVLQSIRDETLNNNIALHLLLDIGQFLRQSTVHSMRYSKISINFWLLVQKLFKRKATRFFRGIKGQGKLKIGNTVLTFTQSRCTAVHKFDIII